MPVRPFRAQAECPNTPRLFHLKGKEPNGAGVLDIGMRRVSNHSQMSLMSTESPDRSIHRRNFLRQGALAAAVAVCSRTVGVTFAESEDAVHRIAVDFIGKYSDEIRILSAGGDVTRIVARVRDVPDFCKALFRARAAGISELRVARTLATFRAGGRAYEVENLLQPDFARFLNDESDARVC
jgi:hypothetical protein